MALTEHGIVYGWGTFRDSSGVYGFAPGTRIQLTPARVYRPTAPDARITRIASGKPIARLPYRAGCCPVFLEPASGCVIALLDCAIYALCSDGCPHSGPLRQAGRC